MNEDDDLPQHLGHLAARGERVAATVDMEGTRFETGRRRVRQAPVEEGVAQQFVDTVDALLLRMV